MQFPESKKRHLRKAAICCILLGFLGQRPYMMAQQQRGGKSHNHETAVVEFKENYGHRSNRA